MRVLGLFLDIPRPDEKVIRELEEKGTIPRTTFLNVELNVEPLDSKFLARAPKRRRWLYSLVPVEVAQVLEAFFVKNEYDLVLSWTEKLAFPFALLCKLTRSKVPHVVMCTWPGKGMKARLLRYVQTHISRMVMWSSVQRDIVINEIGLPKSKVSFIGYFTDQHFFQPTKSETDMICSVGSEMRDYATLVEAMRGLDIRCHIAAGTHRRGTTTWVKAIEVETELPPNVTVGKKNPEELRALYARSRFLVLPLLPSNTDNGITCMLEAMAMGKPVICSRTKGQVDVVREGQTGIFVPPGDSIALRKAIQRLWDNPDEAERMGKEGRKYVEEYQTLDIFVGSIKKIIDETVFPSPVTTGKLFGVVST